MTETVPEVFVVTTTIFSSNFNNTMEETLTHMKSLKFKSYPEENVADFCAAIMLYAE